VNGPLLVIVSLAYFTGFWSLGATIFNKGEDWEVLGAVLGTVSVVMAPVAVFGVQRTMGTWCVPCLACS
jgi:hypothetical protein